MSVSYKVLAPYVTAKVKDINGQDVMLGYYQNGLIHDPVDQKHVDSLVELGMLEEAPDAEPEPEPQGDGQPKGNASREEWAAYAKTKGAADEEVAPVEDGGLKQTELREKYGN